MTTRATSGRNCAIRMPRTGAETPGMDVFWTFSRAPVKSSTRRSGFCMRTGCTSRRPAPSTRIAARWGSCVMATLEITAEVALAPADSCPRTIAGPAPSTTLVKIRQPHRKARQFVVIAVLLHWSRFFYSLAVPLVFRTHLCPSRRNATLSKAILSTRPSYS